MILLEQFISVRLINLIKKFVIVFIISNCQNPQLMEQTDQFYQQLPFTLQQEHLDSEYVILGTGLQQSALAAYLAKMQGKKVLIFDQQKTYGSCLKTITLKQLFQLSQNQNRQRLYQFYIPNKYKESNQNFYKGCNDKKAFRGYNIDVEPSVFFGNSITCESLKQADMDKYMDFRLVNHLLKYEKGKLEQVPLSKGKIFESKTLSLMEKKTLLTSLHTLIKLFQKHANVEEDHNSTKEFDKGFGQVSQELFQYFNDNLEESFVGLLQKITKKNKKIMDFIAYIVCNYQYSYRNPVEHHVQQSFKVKNFIERFGKFINSCGIYGQSPYLYVDNGMGDIPQAFSRIASIFGSTFILHPKLTIDSIEENEDYVSIRSNIAPGQQLKVKQLFYGQTFKDLYSQNAKKDVQLHKQEIFRVLVLCKKLGMEEQCPSIGYFLDMDQFSNPVSLFMFDQSTHTCPSGFILYQFSTILGRKEAAEGSQEKRQQDVDLKTEVLMKKLQEIRGPEFTESIAYLCSSIRQSNSEVIPTAISTSTTLTPSSTLPTTTIPCKDPFSSQRQQQQELPSIQLANQQKQILLKGYGGLDLDYHFQSFIKIIGKKENYFRKKNPYQQELEEDSDQEHRINILERLDNITVGEKIKEDENIKQESKENENQEEIKEEDENQEETKNEEKGECDQEILTAEGERANLLVGEERQGNIEEIKQVKITSEDNNHCNTNNQKPQEIHSQTKNQLKQNYQTNHPIPHNHQTSTNDQPEPTDSPIQNQTQST